MTKCKHENATIETSNLYTSTIDSNGVIDGDPTMLSCIVWCSDCELVVAYPGHKTPKWVHAIIRRAMMRAAPVEY
jgi:hypothetical protein